MQTLPFPVVLLTLAVCPALGEELLFRGLIGRGLVDRWGLLVGVLATPILFGIVHLRPATVLAVIPLGIAMHFVYLTTGSFWAPVLLHFLNNAFAAYQLKFSDHRFVRALTQHESTLPLDLLAASAPAACAILMLLWQTRAGRLPGSWYPGERLPAITQSAPIPLLPERPRPLLIACGTFCVIGFFAVFLRAAFAAN